MSDLDEKLERLGLSQYIDRLIAEGFDTWETVLDITESDLTSLNVKLGHRRKLQRAIAEYRGQSSGRPLQIALGREATGESSYKSDDSASEKKARPGDASATGTTGTAAKRKYRRHPKPDEHAPERPPSAYVIFSNQVREQLRGQDLSFTEIAKVVGERWQVLPATDREACERQANTAKEKYYAELSDYKKTPEYATYQKYLEEFKAKHAMVPKGVEGKRSKLETETSTSTRSSSHERGDRAQNRRVSTVEPDPSPFGRHRPEASSPIGIARITHPPSSTSPASHPLSGVPSPRIVDHYSPLSASPRPTTMHKESSFEIHPSALGRDHPQRQSDPNLPFPSSAYNPLQQMPSTTASSASYPPLYQSPIDLPSRRSVREPTRLPPLTREGTTISSEGSVPPYPAPSAQSTPFTREDTAISSEGSVPPYFASSAQTTPHLPIGDMTKVMRTLPQPVPSLGPSASPLDRPLNPSPPGQFQDYRSSAPLAALLRAGELASREVDDEAMERESDA